MLCVAIAASVESSGCVGEMGSPALLRLLLVSVVVLGGFVFEVFGGVEPVHFRGLPGVFPAVLLGWGMCF